jgi:hypothetical protein
MRNGTPLVAPIPDGKITRPREVAIQSPPGVAPSGRAISSPAFDAARPSCFGRETLALDLPAFRSVAVFSMRKLLALFFVILTAGALCSGPIVP